MTVLVSSEDLLAEAGRLLEETVALRRRLHTAPRSASSFPQPRRQCSKPSTA
jgi:hypothetical protein